MSVDVRNPPAALFLPETVNESESRHAAQREHIFTKQRNVPEASNLRDSLFREGPERRFSFNNHNRKRKFSRGHGGQGHHGGTYQHKRRRHKSQMILPTKFLLGGNIADPLNLNGLSESDELTPVSSPLPTPRHRDVVNVIIPPNITDPLNLVCSDDEANDEMFQNLANKQRKRQKRKAPPKDLSLVEKTDYGPLNIEVSAPMKGGRRSFSGHLPPSIHKDQIVSPVIPQTSPRCWKRKRANSESHNNPVASLGRNLQNEPVNEQSNVDIDSITPKNRTKRQHSGQKNKSKKKGSKFIHGNYNRYYGYRNPCMEEDSRIRFLQKAWFAGKDVLDVGCNTGHVTLTIARDFRPRKIVGVDIDGSLIGVARKNIRHYLLADDSEMAKFPRSMPKCYGPISADTSASATATNLFPQNVFFRQGDFVLESDDLLELQQPEYDIIMALSITKWIHLNHGDSGLKRTFKRFFRMLKPGGMLILEPQGWASYGKRKKLTDAISKNYQSIRMRPDQFQGFLLSRHVGFTSAEQLTIPFNKSQGFRRPIIVFRKANVVPQETIAVSFQTPIPITECAYAERRATASAAYDCAPYYYYSQGSGSCRSARSTPSLVGDDRSGGTMEIAASFRLSTDTSPVSQRSFCDTASYENVDFVEYSPAVESRPGSALSLSMNDDRVLSSIIDSSVSDSVAMDVSASPPILVSRTSTAHAPRPAPDVGSVTAPLGADDNTLSVMANPDTQSPDTGALSPSTNVNANGLINGSASTSSLYASSPISSSDGACSQCSGAMDDRSSHNSPSALSADQSPERDDSPLNPPLLPSNEHSSSVVDFGLMLAISPKVVGDSPFSVQSGYASPSSIHGDGAHAQKSAHSPSVPNDGISPGR